MWVHTAGSGRAPLQPTPPNPPLQEKSNLPKTYIWAWDCSDPGAGPCSCNNLQLMKFWRQNEDAPSNLGKLFCSLQHSTPTYYPFPGLKQKKSPVAGCQEVHTKTSLVSSTKKRIIWKISKWQPGGTNHLLPLLAYLPHLNTADSNTVQRNIAFATEEQIRTDGGWSE